jgi:hypothetical protein
LVDLREDQDRVTSVGKIDDTVPEDKQIHIICDNYATHKHAKVKRWLELHPRFQVHFTPTSSSWLNMVERFFRDLTQNHIRRGIFKNLEHLIVNRRLHRRPQQEPKAFHLDRKGFRHPRQSLACKSRPR